MTTALKRLLWMNISSGIIFNYMGIFINLFIWEKGNQIFDVAWFNLVMFLAWGVAFMYGANLLSKFTIGSVMDGIHCVLLHYVLLHRTYDFHIVFRSTYFVKRSE